MPHQHETKSTTIQAMAIALCLIILLSGFAWIIFEKVNDNLFSQESANHLEQFQRNLKIFMVWLLVVLTGISVWVGHRLPRRGWFWNVCVAALFYASVCVFLVFSRMTTDVTAVIARWGYIENLFLLIMIASRMQGNIGLQRRCRQFGSSLGMYGKAGYLSAAHCLELVCWPAAIYPFNSINFGHFQRNQLWQNRKLEKIS